MSSILEDIILPDKPIMLRWRQSENTQTTSPLSQISPLKSSVGNFTVTLPKTASSPPRTAGVGAKFVNFTSSNPHQKKRSKEKRTPPSPHPKVHSKDHRKLPDQETQHKPTRAGTVLSTSSEEKPKPPIPHYPSPLDRYFFNTTPFPITNLSSLNTGHYTNYYLHSIANIMYPLTNHLTFNPIRDKWFEVILQDETWFFTIIYVAARQLEAEHGASESSQQVSRLMAHVLGRLKDGVEMARRGYAPPDAVIGAVSCLVSLENGLQNTSVWKMHSRGLSELVKAKGGIHAIDTSIRAKVCRSDIEGAVDTLSTPHFPPVEPRSKQLTPIAQSTTYPLSSTLSPTLAAIAKDIADFTSLLCDLLTYSIPIDPVDLDEHLLIFFHRLLSYTPPPQSHLSQAFKITLLLYLKSLMRPLESLASSSTFLASTLKESLSHVRDAPRSLTLWMAFWGMLASKDGSEERGWFREKVLVDIMILKGRMCGWEEVRPGFVKVFWVGEMFDEFSRRVWEGMERGIVAARMEGV